MTDKVAVRFQPQRAEIAIERGMTVLQAAMSGKVNVPHKCGGHGSCGTCKVQVDSRTALLEPNALEWRHLSEERVAQGFRLACQCQLTGPATVVVPEEPWRRVVREMLAAQKAERDQKAERELSGRELNQNRPAAVEAPEGARGGG